MRCISISKFGGPEVLEISTSIPKPLPQGKQVLVNVKAASVNPVDTYIRSGGFPGFDKVPFTPGLDGAGIVEDIGEGVTKVKNGDRVWFCGTLTGAYAEYCVCEEADVNPLPEKYSFEEGSTLGVPYLTAHRSLFQKANVQRGETVLIHGASGGVGTAAIQMCHSYGVRVIGTAGSEEGIKMLKEMGLDTVYNHRQQGYIEQLKKNEPKIDVILEMLANVNLQSDLEMVSNRNGRIVIIGSRGNTNINPNAIMGGEIQISGVLILNSTPKERAEQADFVNKGLQTGWIKPVIWKVMDLEKACDAHTEILVNKGAKGQIALKV